jgi:hypothetical protein
VRENGIPFPAAGYTFAWFEADGITPLPGAVTANTYSGLAAGTYQVRATSLASSCSSLPRQVTLNDATSDPFVIASAIAPNANCGGASPQRLRHHRHRRRRPRGQLPHRVV